MSLHSMIAEARSGVLLFGITPPRRTAQVAQIKEIADVTLARLAGLGLDGLTLYDIDDESDRNAAERPFPYLPTIDPADFLAEYLQAWDRPAVVYRCVGKYTENQMRDWLAAADTGRVMSVFVGPSSGQKAVLTELPQAHALRGELRPDLVVGGVAITERYSRGRDEHLRMLSKQDRGCAFFITQVIYDVDATKSMLSDYYYACASRGVAPRPVILTLSVCGSLKTLAFLQWLGVAVPRWLENNLLHAEDPLPESFAQCLANARELSAFCRRLGLPYGFNVESVSIRRVEIEAAVALAASLRTVLDS
jgi:hypothetical protein